MRGITIISIAIIARITETGRYTKANRCITTICITINIRTTEKGTL